MPTESLKSILDRELSLADAKSIIDISSPYLREIINYGTNLLARCETSSTGKENEDVAPLILYFHIIEMTDGIEVLLNQSCPVTAIPLIRSSFEALLYLEYIMESDYKRRSIAFLNEMINNQIEAHELMIPTTQRAKTVRKEYEKDIANKGIRWPDPSKALYNINFYNKLKRGRLFEEIEIEKCRLKIELDRKPKWHELYGGPSSLNDLAIVLYKKAQYDILYRDWSAISHAIAT